MPDDKEHVLRVAKEAAEDWFVYTGKIGHRDEFDVTKKIADYGITGPDFFKLSEDIVSKVERSTGKTLVLPHNWHEEFRSKPLADFIRALPGESGTRQSHPSSLPGSPSTPPPGKSTVPASHPSALPGKKRGSSSSDSESGAS